MESDSVTFVHSSIFVLYHRQLVDLSELLKDGFQVLFFQIPWNLPDKQFNSVGLLH